MSHVKFLISLSLLFISGGVFAQQVVSANQCAQLSDKTSPFLLVLKKGESISESILKCANDAGIDNGSIQGIGAVKDPELAYYDLNKKIYRKHELEGIFEILGMNGDISLLKDKRMVHIHTVIGDEHYQTHGGHLFQGTIGVTGEFMITPMKGKAVRKFNKETGLSLITPQS